MLCVSSPVQGVVAVRERVCVYRRFVDKRVGNSVQYSICGDGSSLVPRKRSLAPLFLCAGRNLRTQLWLSDRLVGTRPPTFGNIAFAVVAGEYHSHRSLCTHLDNSITACLPSSYKYRRDVSSVNLFGTDAFSCCGIIEL